MAGSIARRSLLSGLFAWLLFAVSSPVVAAPDAASRAPATKDGTAAAEAGEETITAIVRLKARILPDARTAAFLGREREGSGVLLPGGYVLTIGYLVMEAESVEVVGSNGETVPATVAAYDHASGFGVLKLGTPITGKALVLGDSTRLTERDPALVVTAGEGGGARVVYVVSRRAFAGTWEYLLESAIYTYPPVPNWSGAALLGKEGELLGIGSLIVRDAAEPGTQSPGNLFVPIDLAKPLLAELAAKGSIRTSQRPWLGINTEEVRGRLFVNRVSTDGPAARAGVKAGDIVMAVGGRAVTSQADFYRKVWGAGTAGVEVPLRVLQGDAVNEVRVRSVDRLDWFRKKPVY